MTTIVMVPGSDEKPPEGVTRHIYEISRRLGRKGFNILAISLLNHISSQAKISLVDNSYILIKMPSVLSSFKFNNNKLAKIISTAAYSFDHKKIVRSIVSVLEKPIIIHTHGFFTVCQPKEKCSNYGRISTFHGFVPLDIIQNEKNVFKAKIYTNYLRRIYNKSDYYTTFTTQMKFIASFIYSISNERIEVIPHGVDAKFFQKDLSTEEIEFIKKRYGIDKSFIILFVGQLSRSKRPDLMLKALKIVRSKKRDIMLVLRSSWGDYYIETLKLIRKLDLSDSVRIIQEPLYGNLLNALYKASNVFINIHNLYSGYSTALLEAMASGIPPIIYKYSGNKYVVDECCGFILNELSSIKLAELIESIMENQALIKRKGFMAKQKMLKEYDWDQVVVPKYISVYTRLAQLLKK